MLESTGRLQKCRIYEMTDNKTARATIAYLIVRDQAHENAYAKALESLGILTTEVAPEGFPMDIAVERPEEFAPGLDPDLLKLRPTIRQELAADARRLRGLFLSGDAGDQRDHARTRLGSASHLPQQPPTEDKCGHPSSGLVWPKPVRPRIAPDPARAR